MDTLVVSGCRRDQRVLRIKESRLEVNCAEVPSEKSVFCVLDPVNSPHTLVFVLPLRNPVDNATARIGLRNREVARKLHGGRIESDSRREYVPEIADVGSCVGE